MKRKTIPDLLNAPDPGGLALLPIGSPGLCFEEVRLLSASIAGQLQAAGLGRPDRVAVAVPNGPDAALAFLGVTMAAVAAPLNPSYTAHEFRLALEDLPASALLTDGSIPAAAEAAASLGVRILELGKYLTPVPGSGSFVRPQPDDLALVLHTSGTTGRPKRVPLTHRNLATSAVGIADSLALAPGDRCLNVMPLFHVHGLIGALLASLAAGAAMVAPPRFDAFRFVAWVEEASPTWYTAVPSIHQAVLARARGRHPGKALFRLIRSCSSPLAPSLMIDLESAFGAPVIEAYGMTEAAHQIASNPLPPLPRKAGSVGKASGTELAIVSADGSNAAPGQQGEVVIRGPAVTAGYEGTESSEYRLPGGWLRTGDQGYLDEDRYLFLTGRLKELINRGGEKISPREVEEAFLFHPAVSQALAFSIPHPSLGEEVGLAVVLKPGASAGPDELRGVAADRLAAHKTPRKIVFLEHLPLGPTGKPLRTGMAERLGLA